MAVFQWCLAALLLCVAAVRTDTTTERPIIEYDGLPVSSKRFLTKEYRHKMRNEFEMTNPTHVNGEELFESDILLTPEQRKMMADRKATPYDYRRWSNGPDGNPLVPYVFSDSNVDQAAVQAAIDHWEEHTCIRFTPATDTNAPHLQFFMGDGCWSYVGMVYSTGQQISIGSGCTSLGTVAHEIGHAMGFHHEQSRSDRDSYVHINTDKIISGKEGNFDKANDNSYSVQYDYSSNMHYGGDYFTNDGHLTIATINPLAQELIGSRKGLSHYDKLLANRMYPCLTNWLTACDKSSDPCQNDGYLGADCNCVCPAGTSGTNCETVTGGYYDSLLSGCSEKVTAEGTITSPNYPSNYPSGLKCVKEIQAPSDCYTVKIKFNAFQMYGQNSYCNGQLCCYFDSLEIRTSNPYDGDIYCDTMISAGQEFTSSNGKMILYFKTGTNYYSGWSADVSFIASSSCTDTTTTTSSTTTSTSTTTTTSSTTSPTTTTTTSPTTTTTTSPTTTTTTSPTTTTSTTTSSTTTAASGGCNHVELNSGALQWISPLFGQQNYSNDYTCSLTHEATKPSWAFIKFNRFELEEPNTHTGSCYDYVSFSRLYNMSDIELCDSQTGRKLRLPTYNFVATFHTDYSVVAPGFKITTLSKSSNCHKLIQTGGTGSTGIIKTPKKANKAWTKKACEWWIEAPEGKIIKLKFIKVKVDGTCEKSSVLVNGDGAKDYPVTSSQQYCGTRRPSKALSNGNKMNVMFFSNKSIHQFKARWTVIDAVIG